MADPEVDCDALRAELGDKAAMLLAHTLVHYIDQGHPLEEACSPRLDGCRPRASGGLVGDLRAFDLYLWTS